MIRIALVMLTLLVVGLPTLSAQEQLSPPRQGAVVTEGTRLRFFGINYSNDNQAHAFCRAECAKDPRCRGYTYVRIGGYNPGDGPVCYLFTNITSIAAHRCCVTATKQVTQAPSPPDVSGMWTDSGGTTWQLQATGPGLSSLHASWQGTGGHAGLRGSFNGTLTQQGGAYAYTGAMTVTEGSVYVTGTMTFVVVASNRLSMSYQGSNGGQGQNIILARQSVSPPPLPPGPTPPPQPSPTPPPPSTGDDVSKWVIMK